MDAPADDELAPTRAAPVAWDLSPRWQRFFYRLNFLFGAVATCGISLLILGAGSRFDIGVTISLSIAMVLIVPVALLVHEGGHWLAARWAGMAIAGIALWSLEAMPYGHGLRVRWRKRDKAMGVDGYVLAFPDPKRDLRRSLMMHALGGPLANLLVAAFSISAAFYLERSIAKTAWELSALLNFSMCVGNLFPRMLGSFASDGLLWLRASRNSADRIPRSTFSIISGRLLHGESVNDLPVELLERLAAEPEPMPLYHDWLMLKRSLDVRDLDRVAEFFEKMRTRFGSYDPSKQKAMADLMALAEAEWLFSQAWRTGSPAVLDALDAKQPAFWYTPHLVPRLRALAAALRGDRDAARKQLALSRGYAEGAADPSLRAEEARLRREIEALIDAGPGSLHKDRETVASA
ncbi:M50 family metallopeptidase [Lysobacter antibioticus]|uniref:M50 family metallopeptidase n=1 Tax=Lysobacter antibioticus TaxID=84531 RepID=UPI0004D02B99|nr:M50 family metallopeptidase [Lysobacter antibioticus]